MTNEVTTRGQESGVFFRLATVEAPEHGPPGDLGDPASPRPGHSAARFPPPLFRAAAVHHQLAEPSCLDGVCPFGSVWLVPDRPHCL